MMMVVDRRNNVGQYHRQSHESHNHHHHHRMVIELNDPFENEDCYAVNERNSKVQQAVDKFNSHVIETRFEDTKTIRYPPIAIEQFRGICETEGNGTLGIIRSNQYLCEKTIHKDSIFHGTNHTDSGSSTSTIIPPPADVPTEVTTYTEELTLINAATCLSKGCNADATMDYLFHKNFPYCVHVEGQGDEFHPSTSSSNVDDSTNKDGNNKPLERSRKNKPDNSILYAFLTACGFMIIPIIFCCPKQYGPNNNQDDQNQEGGAIFGGGLRGTGLGGSWPANAPSSSAIMTEQPPEEDIRVTAIMNGNTNLGRTSTLSRVTKNKEFCKKLDDYITSACILIFLIVPFMCFTMPMFYTSNTGFHPIRAISITVCMITFYMIGLIRLSKKSLIQYYTMIFYTMAFYVEGGTSLYIMIHLLVHDHNVNSNNKNDDDNGDASTGRIITISMILHTSFVIVAWLVLLLIQRNYILQNHDYIKGVSVNIYEFDLDKIIQDGIKENMFRYKYLPKWHILFYCYCWIIFGTCVSCIVYTKTLLILLPVAILCTADIIIRRRTKKLDEDDEDDGTGTDNNTRTNSSRPQLDEVELSPTSGIEYPTERDTPIV